MPEDGAIAPCDLCSWQGLPMFLKKEVIDYLNYKSRCCVEKVCRRSRTAAVKVPLKLDQASLHINNDHIKLFAGSDIPVLYNSSALETAIQDFLHLFQNRFSKFDICVLFGGYLTPEQYNMVSGLLLPGFRSLSSNHFLNVKKFEFVMANANLEDYLEIFQRLNPRTIEHLVFRLPLKNLHDWNVLIQHPQWSSAKKLYIHFDNNLPILEFIRFDTFYTHFHKISSEDIASVIQSFRTGIRPVGSFFRITMQKFLQHEDILQLCNVTRNNEPVLGKWKPTHPVHTQRFQLPIANQMLVVTFHEWKIDGKICHVDKIVEESEIVI